MGVRSSHLRGQALSDLIYKPTTIEQEIAMDERKDDRKASSPDEDELKEEKTSPTSPARDAFVELVYSLSAEELPLFPAPSRPYDELRFRRSITRAGVSQYRINDRALKWEEYSAELEKLGVSVKAKNFLVFQGDVESIAQRTPRQMSDMLDVICGSAALKDEYERRKEEAERGDEEFLRVVERHSTVKRERLALRKQKEEAEEYQRLVAEEAQHKTDLALWQFYHLCEDQTEKEAEKADTQQRLDDKAQERAELEAQLKELQADLARRKRQLTEAEKTLTDRSRRLEKKRPDHIRLREEIRHLRGQITRQEKELEAWQAKRDVQRREVRKLEDDLRRVREELQLVNDTEAKEEEKAREVQLAEADRREYAELRKRLNAAVNELTERRRALLADIKRQRDAIERQLEMVAELRGRRAKEDDIRREMARRAQQLTEQTEEVRRGLDANRKKRAEGERKRGQQSAQKAKMSEELSALVARLDEASSRSRDSSRQQKAAGMVDVLQRHFTQGGIHGRLSELVTPSAKKYELPCVIALGRHLDSVVVESERVALDCVEYLREQKMGVCTFIPLDSIRVQPLSESLRNLGGSARLLVDVLVFEERFTRALLYAVGSTVVADRLDEAQRLKFGGGIGGQAAARMKIVTVDGSVIHKGGNMTGGVGRHQGQDVRRFDAKQVDADRARKDELVGRLREMDSARADDEQRALDAAISRDDISLRYLEADRKTNAAQLARKEAEVKDVEAKLAELEADAAVKEREVQGKEAELATVERDMGREEQRVFAAFNRRIGVRSIREYEEGRLKAVEEYSRRKADLSKQEAALQSALEYEKGREEGEKTERKMRGRLDANRLKLEDAIGKEAEKTEEIDADKEGVSKAADAVREAALSVEEKEAEVKEAQKRLALLTDELSALQKALSALNGSLDLIRDEMRELMKTARVDNVALPRKKGGQKRGSRATEKKSSKRSRRGRSEEEEEEENGEEEEGEDGQEGDVEMITDEEQALLMESGDPCATLDFSRVEERDTRSVAERERQRAAFQQVISDLRASAEKLAPNLKAIDKYRDIQERLEAVGAELEAKREEQKEVEAAFAEVKEQRKRLFLDCFEHLRSSIQTIYQALTASVDLPMGGKAMLLLEGEDDEPYLHGVIYRVMPPMKRYMPMEALSGGEKTVASLALIFALHHFKPSPFFVLDEIDAALDNINVQRVANYVKARATRDHLQVIVISLKETFYSKANSLIGVYRDVDTKSSANLTLDLTKYD